MPAHVFDGTLNTYSVGGSSQLEYLENARGTFESQTQEGAAVLYGGSNIQETKLRGRFDVSLHSDVSTGIRLSHLDLSAASLGAVNLLSPQIVNSLRWRVQMSHVMKAGAGTKLEYPQVSGRQFSCDLDVDFDSASTPDLLIAMFSSTYADRDKTLTFVLNGVSVSMPMRIIGVPDLPYERQGKQRYSLALGDRSGLSGSTITPSGTTTLLEKAINAYKTVVAYSFKGSASYNISLAGNMVWDRYELNIADGQLVPSSMAFLVQTLTPTTVGA